MRTSSTWIKNLALVGASLVVALILGEGALRVAGFSYPNFWLPDPVTGTALRPGMEGWQRDEGRVYVKISAQGLRDRQHTLAKADGVYRIAILGDSYAEALQVELERTFWSLLPKKLESCGFARGKSVETINFGVSGFGTGNELLTLRTRVWQYSPDMVLLAFFPGNDVRNNSPALEKERFWPFFSLKDGKLHLDAAFRDDPEFREKQRIAIERAALQDLRMYQLMRRVRAGSIVQHLHNAPIAAAIASGSNGGDKLTEPGLDEQVFHEPRDAKWREAWDITDRLLVAASEETRNKRVRFVVTVLSTPGSVFPNPQMRARYAQSLGVETLFYPEQRLTGLGERHGFDVVALAPEMQKRADATQTYFHGFANTKPGFGHWNEAGHAAAAELIAERLCSKK
ncbi:MAG TPA: SGNH/GDSL hydrolase family protein [Burkholderiales bacterium]|nr:SGNH/GDSL hydrolase family protein [Burkholderiales bacterium]